jgi:hypothetical protein
MSSRTHARARKYGRVLCKEAITRILSQTLPRRNGYLRPNTAELLKEATDFGIHTELQFRRLLLKHRRALLADDRAALRDRLYMASLSDDNSEAHLLDMRRRQFCFTWEALTRNALELEYGAAYEEYSRKRDGL